MLDIKELRKDPVAVEKRLNNKTPGTQLAPILELDGALRQAKTRAEELKAQRNHSSKEVGLAKQKGQDPAPLLKGLSELSDQIHACDQEMVRLEEALHRSLAFLPNLPFDEIPISESPKDNVCIKTWGEKKPPSFPLKNHVELNETLRLFDFQRGAKIAGSGWPIYRGMGARLEWALLNYMLDTHRKNGFTQIMPPLLARPEVLYGSAQLPKFQEQLFHLQDEDFSLYLIPTAEVTLNGLHAEEILESKDLPLKYTAYTPCFRREAGAAGAQERGLIRTHQFNKVELFALTLPEKSPEMFDALIESAEQILQGLELHYRNMLLTTGDMSFAAAKTVDVEVWLPGQNRYYEVSSVSNCTDFQSRRSQIRYREEGKLQFVHTLNGSGLATSRLMVALLENNQQEDGSILVPKVLHKYLGEEILSIQPRE